MSDEELTAFLRDLPFLRAAAAADRIEALTAEVGELQEVFDFQWKANMRAVEMWRAANPGNDLVLPDSANLTVWLLERNETLTVKLAQATWLLTEAAVQLEEGKIKTRRNRAAIIWNLLDEMKADNAP